MAWAINYNGKWINDDAKRFLSPCCRDITPVVYFNDDGSIKLLCQGRKLDIPCKKEFRAIYDTTTKRWTITEI